MCYLILLSTLLTTLRGNGILTYTQIPRYPNLVNIMNLKSQSIKAALSVAVLPVLFGCSQDTVEEKAVPRPMPVFEVSGNSVEQRTFTGRAKASREANLAARIPGTLIKLPVKVGNMVKAGDVLSEIDPQDFKTALESARGQLDQMESEVEFANREYQRILNIKKTNPQLVSPSRFDLSKRNLQSARAGLTQAKAAVKQANDNLRYTKLTAPFDGQVSAVLVENHEEVAPKQPMVRILDTSKIEMVIDIPEQLISSVPKVFDIKVTFDAFPTIQIPAQIKEVGSESDPVTRTYPITLEMDQLKTGATKILSGMAGRASGKVSHESKTKGFSIPVKALGQDSDGETFVWKVSAQGGLQKVTLHSVQIQGKGVLVKGELNPGDLLALAGIHSINQNTLVKPFAAGQ